MLQSNKKKIFFLIIFTIIICVITMFLIKYSQNRLDENAILNTTDENIVENSQSLNTEIEEKDMEYVIDLETTKVYDNPLVISNDFRYNDNENFTYIQISGLKDKELENRINNEIIEYVRNAYNQYGKNVDGGAYTYVNANYSNVLSIGITIFKGNNNNGNSENECYYLNYNLRDGEKINLDDIYTSKSKFLSALRDTAYKTYVWDYARKNESESDLLYDMKNVDYSAVEDDVYKMILDFKSGKINDFLIGAKEITILYNDKDFYIEIQNYIDAISICTKYATDNLDEIYENPSLVTYKHYALTNDDTVYEYKNIIDEDNIYASLYIDGLSEPENIYNIAKKYIDNKLNEISNLHTNDDEFYIISYNICIENTTEDNKYYLSVYDTEYKTTKSRWNNEIKKILLEEWRVPDSGGGISSYYDIDILEDKYKEIIIQNEYYKEIYDENAEIVYLTEEEAQNIAELEIQEFINIENITLDEAEKDESGKYTIWEYDISGKFGDNGFEKYLENAKDYINIEIIQHTDEDGYQYEEKKYYLTKQERYQLGKVIDYAGFDDIKLIDQNSYSIIITSKVKYVDEFGVEDIYNLKLILKRSDRWYIDDYEITKF